MSKTKKRLFTGIRPTGELHLGNYLGAIQPAVKNQEAYESFLCVVDLHAITEPYDPQKMAQQITSIAIDYLAGGIDPKKSVLFIQSHIHEHVELMWLLNTITPVGELQRMIQYKELSQKYGNPLAGILNYPILMAADILLYKAEIVPVGDDQMQHIELTSALAKKFNNQFGATFTSPQNTVKKEKTLRLKALHDPTKKMSKSLGPKSYIALSDDEKTIRKKIGSAVTDTGSDKKGEMSPGVKNLFDLLKLTDTSGTYEHMLKKYSEKDLKYSEFKPVVADCIVEYLKPIQEKRKELEDNLDYVAKVLVQGAEKARKVAQNTMAEVKEKMGLL